MRDLTVSIIQTSLYWQSAMDNLNHFDQLLEGIEHTDLIILPEMFTTGFSMQAELLAEPMQGPTLQWMADHAAKKQCALCGSIIVKEQGHYFNRLLFMQPDGHYEYYDKRHLFRMAKEHQHYREGRRKLILEWRGWCICPQICYDLRFPVWSRNHNNAYDLLVYVANWPAKRDTAWRSLLPARAIENLSYVIGVNRVGQDGNQIEYAGSSLVVDMAGSILEDCQSDATIKTVCLSGAALQHYRERFPAYLDADSFTIDIVENGNDKKPDA